jgi:uncharacterized protein
MAASTLLALIDDIATLLDDVSVMTKVAAKKTAGVLGDDLALNAQQVSGVHADRELPVVWAVAKGSLRNKVILVPAALAISALAPWAVLPLLMLGGLYLCFEGFEKIAHKVLHPPAADARHHEELAHALADPAVDVLAYEREKVQGAIRTDFILSAEIITIALGTVADKAFGQQVTVLSLVALVMTVGVYGLVAGIVKLDDAGFHLLGRTGPGLWRKAQRGLGAFLLWLAPWLMKSLSVLGTAAMFLVGGSIIAHGIPGAHEFIRHAAAPLGPVVAAIVPTLADLLIGLLSGAAALALVTVPRRGGSGPRHGVLRAGAADATHADGGRHLLPAPRRLA